MSTPPAVRDDATLVAERAKSAKAHDRLVAAARALHSDIYAVYDHGGAPGPHVGLGLLPTRPETFDPDALAHGLMEFARRFSGGQAEGLITSDGDRLLGLRYTADGTSATLTNFDRVDTVLATGTLVEVLVAASKVVLDDHETNQALLAAGL